MDTTSARRQHDQARLPARLVVIVLSVAVASCASTAPTRLRQVTPLELEAASTDLSRVVVHPGRDYVATTRGGETVRGRIASRTTDTVIFSSGVAMAPQMHLLHDRELLMLGLVTGASRMKRGWIGAAIGAAVSAPFGISIPGDMAVPAAIVGAQIGRRTGDERIEVLLDRRQSTAPPVPPTGDRGRHGHL